DPCTDYPHFVENVEEIHNMCLGLIQHLCSTSSCMIEVSHSTITYARSRIPVWKSRAERRVPAVDGERWRGRRLLHPSPSLTSGRRFVRIAVSTIEKVFRLLNSASDSAMHVRPKSSIYYPPA